jgi:hypothetical protein
VKSQRTGIAQHELATLMARGTLLLTVIGFGVGTFFLRVLFVFFVVRFVFHNVIIIQ